MKMRNGSLLKLAGIAAAIISVSFPAFSDEAELADLKQKFNDAYARTIEPVTQLNKSYSKALERAFEETTAKGRLDDTLLIKNEYEKFSDGSNFDQSSFEERATDLPQLEAMRSTYLSGRERRLGQLRRKIETLLDTYKKTLITIEQRETRDQNLRFAIAAREQREALDRDPRFSEAPTIGAATVHFVAKGEFKISLNDTSLSFRNRSDNPQYVDGETRPRDMKVGDILFVEMNGTAVFRSMIIALETEDGSRVLPFKASDYVYLGPQAKTKDITLDKLEKITARPTPGSADPDMSIMWKEHDLSPPGKNECEWVIVGTAAEWHTFALVIRPEILE